MGEFISVEEARRRRRGSGSAPGADSAPAGDDPRPVVKVQAGELPSVVDAAEEALACHPGPIYQRGGQLVHVTAAKVWRSDGSTEEQAAIAPVTLPRLREELTKSARFEKWQRREREWVTIDCPGYVAEAYLSRAQWNVLPLRQLIATPTLRRDGSLLESPGYDAATGLFLTGRPLYGLCVPDRPTESEALGASDVLAAFFESFPFADGETPGLGISLCKAAVLGTILRPTIATAPLIAVTAPAAGTGKSYLVDLWSVIGAGDRAAVIAVGKGPEEFEKVLHAALLTGRPFLTFDNVADALGGASLCQAITQPSMDVRPLGASRMVTVPTSASFHATGNNLQLREDMARRTLLLRLDAGMERPEDRAFEVDLIEEALRRRAELVSAALTIARWHALAGHPAPRGGRSLAGFDDWCRRVRDPLLALGDTDPLLALNTSRLADDSAQEFQAFAEAWAEACGDERKTVGALLEMLDQRDFQGGLRWPALSAAVLSVAGGSGGPNAKRLGRYLSRHADHVVQGKRFRMAGIVRGQRTWQIRVA